MAAADRRVPPLAYGLLILLCLALYLPGFFTLPPFDRDESRFAQASYQMLESGDLVDIRFQDEPRHKKPVGIYWLQSAATAAAEAVVGPPGAKAIWTYRLPSLAGAVAAVLLTAWAGARLFGTAVGVTAAAMLAGCVVLGVEARLAKTDAVLLAALVAAQGALALAYRARPGEGEAAAPRWTWLLFWGAAGVSVLVKGPLVALVSGGTVAGLVLADRVRDGRWSGGWLRALRPGRGLLLLAAMVLPWLVAIAVQTRGAFFAESVGHDMLGKVAGGQEGKGLPPGYYLLTFLVTFQPWAFLALAAVPWAWANRGRAAVRFCLAWIIPAWIVFEAVPTKLLHYTIVTFPAVALLAAAMLHDGYGRLRGRRPFMVALGLGAFGVTALTVAVAVLPWVIDRRINPAAVAAVPVVLVLFAGMVALLNRGRRRLGLAAGLAAAGTLYAAAYGATLPAVDGLWVSRSAAALVAANHPCPGAAVASAGYSEPSLVFLMGTDTALVTGDKAAAHLAADPACALALVESRQEAAFRTGLDAAGIAPARVEALGTAEGLNYNNGRRVVLTLYRLGR